MNIGQAALPVTHVFFIKIYNFNVLMVHLNVVWCMNGCLNGLSGRGYRTYNIDT